MKHLEVAHKLRPPFHKASPQGELYVIGSFRPSAEAGVSRHTGKSPGLGLCPMSASRQDSPASPVNLRRFGNTHSYYTARFGGCQQEKGLTGELRRGIIDVEDKPKNKAGIAEDLMTAGPVII